MSKNKLNIFLVNLVIVGMVLGLMGAVLTQAAPEPLARKIIVFKPGVLNDSAREVLVAKFGGVKVKDLNLIEGKAVFLSPKAQVALAAQSGVLRIDDDVVVQALEKPAPGNVIDNLVSQLRDRVIVPQSQTIPWGITKINAPLAWPTTIGQGIKVGIIDTGISNNHPDLLANVKGGVNTINSRRSWNDDNGHGTHVAGTVAAVNNTVGVVGVGPQVSLYAIKVLNASGSGYLSDVIEGLDWAIQNKMQVVNMSLGAVSDVQSFHDAVERVNNAGITQVAAAGNSGGSVGYPAAYSEVMAVSATDQNNVIASWSSRGAEVDLAAPGVSIYSTYKGTGYATLSGTSMATPHVTGSAALVLSVLAKCDLNSDGKCSPAEVKQRLETTATDLGLSGPDNLYGYGLVNAQKAVTQ